MCYFTSASIFPLLINTAGATKTLTEYNPIGADWKPFSIDWTSKQTPVWDFSRDYHTPAGKFGHVRVKGPHFILGNSGKRLRMWGTNLCATSCLPPRDYVPKIIRYLKRWGFNAVRFAHIDSHWARGVINYKNKYELEFNEKKFDRLFYFMAELKKNGLYYVIDGRHGFFFHTTKFNYLNYRWRDKSGSIFLTFSTQMQRHHEKYLRKLFSTKNKYTGMTLGEDPALAGVQMLNETFLMRNSTKLKNLKNIPAEIRPDFLKKWEEWNKLSGQKLSYDNTEKTERKQFFSWLERNYYSMMMQFYRNKLGVKCPIATTSCYVSPAGFPAALEGDFTEGHSYYNLSYQSAMVIQDSVTLKSKKVKLAKVERNPAYINRKFTRWLPFTIRQRIGYQPYVLGEWNSSHPFPERFDSPLWMAALGGIQDFDGMFLFTLAQMDWEKIHKRNIDYVISFEDPSIMINMIPAALAWHGKMIPAAPELAVTIPNKALFGTIHKNYYRNFYENALNFRMYNCPTGQGERMPPPEVKRIDYDQRVIDALPELTKKAKEHSPIKTYKHYAVIKTQKFVSVWGRLNGKLEAYPLEIIPDTKQDFSVTAVTLDNKPLTTSKKVLIAIGPISLAKGTLFIDKKDEKNGKILGTWSLNRKMCNPMVKPICATIRLLSGKKWRCYRVSNAGIKGELIATSKDEGIHWKLQPENPAYFYFLEMINN